MLNDNTNNNARNTDNAWAEFEQKILNAKNKDGWRKHGKKIETQDLEDVSQKIIKNKVAAVKNEDAIDVGVLDNIEKPKVYDSVDEIPYEIDVSTLRETPTKVAANEVADIEDYIESHTNGYIDLETLRIAPDETLPDEVTDIEYDIENISIDDYLADISNIVTPNITDEINKAIDTSVLEDKTKQQKEEATDFSGL